MSANHIGKGLVLVHLVLSMLALSWAASIFLQFTDWGWKEPRKELDYRVPSEFDKRSAALKQALRARDLVYGAVKPAQVSLRDAEERFPQNNLYYRAEMKRLKSDPNAIEVMAPKYEGGVLVLDTPGRAIGKPLMDEPVPIIQKSYDEYRKDLAKLHDEADEVRKEVRTWVEKAKDITDQLNGLDAEGAKTRKGLYELLDIESQTQSKLKFEMDYLQPIWVDAIKEAEIYRARRVRLELAVERAKQARGK
jgi:hypothetical protein